MARPAQGWRDGLPQGIRERYFTYLMTAIDSVEIPLSQRQRSIDIAETVEREFYETALNKLEYEDGILKIIERLTRPTSQLMQLVVRRIGPITAPTNRTLVNTASSADQGSSSGSQYFPPLVSEQEWNQRHNYFQSRAGPSTLTREFPSLIPPNIAYITTRLASAQAYMASSAGHRQNQASEERVGRRREETFQRINQMRKRYYHRLCRIYNKLFGTSKQGLTEAERLELMRIMATLNSTIRSLSPTEITPLSRETLDRYERDIVAFIYGYQM